MRLLFMGTPHFAVPTLKKLLSSPHQVVAVITQSDKSSGRGARLSVPPVKRLGLEHEIPVYQPEKLKAETWQNRIQALAINAIVVVAYGKILPAWFFTLPQYGAINLHASLLPKYRGAAPIHWAIANGENTTGVTTMRIEAGLDSGTILLQEKVDIAPGETAVDLHDRLAATGSDLMLRTLDLLERHEIEPIPQDPKLATYAPPLKKSDGELIWEQTSIQVYNRIRAFNPWPGTYTYLHGALLRIWKAAPVEIDGSNQTPGTLTHDRFLGAVVTCRQGSLQLQQVQLENRKKILAQDFLHGIRLPQNQSVLLGR
jgi:methionyl-tRNA formyltransferase